MFAGVSIDYWGTTELRWGQGGARKVGKHCLQSPLCRDAKTYKRAKMLV